MPTTLVRYQARRNTAAVWTSANEVLLAGEPGYESDTGRFKLGDGTTAWGALAYQGASSTQLDARYLHTLSAKDPQFAGGAKGDGVTDDTAALQAFITYLTVNARSGFIPDGTYKITAALNFSYRPGWTLRGAGRGSTTIKQFTSNTAIFNLGSDTASLMHTFAIEDLTLDYATAQTGQTGSTCILFSQMVFQGIFRNLTISGGYDGMRVAAGIGCPWGSTWDDLVFGTTLRGSAMDWTQGVNGTPNNKFGRITVNCTNLTKPYAVDIRGYNFVIDTIEFLSNNNGLGLLQMAPGSNAEIGALKLEVGTFATGGTVLFNFQTNAKIRIGQIVVQSSSPMVSSFTTGQLVAVATGSGTGRVDIDSFEAAGFSTNSGNQANYCFGASPGAPITVKHVSFAGGWLLHNVASQTTANDFTVTDWITGRYSLDKGDADYTVALTDPNGILYLTPFTAPRTLNLPSVGTSLFNGLYYDVILNGAINGTNTLTVKSSTTTLRVQTVDKVRVRFAWRRNPAAPNGPGGWFLADYVTLP